MGQAEPGKGRGWDLGRKAAPVSGTGAQRPALRHLPRLPGGPGEAGAAGTSAGRGPAQQRGAGAPDREGKTGGQGGSRRGREPAAGAATPAGAGGPASLWGDLPNLHFEAFSPVFQARGRDRAGEGPPQGALSFWPEPGTDLFAPHPAPRSRPPRPGHGRPGAASGSLRARAQERRRGPRAVAEGRGGPPP